MRLATFADVHKCVFHDNVCIWIKLLLRCFIMASLKFRLRFPWSDHVTFYNGRRDIGAISVLNDSWNNDNLFVKHKRVAIGRTLHWRHNGCDGVSNHQPHDCLFNGLFRRRSKKHESSASLAFVRGIHRGPVNSPHKGPETRKMFPFDDVIMSSGDHCWGGMSCSQISATLLKIGHP